MEMQREDELPMIGRRMTVLLTGASGVVGSALLDRWSDDPAAPEVIALVHRRPVGGRGVRSVRGNVTAPGLGLPAGEYEALVRRVDVVVHAAAVVSFRAAGQLADTNVGGTREAIAFAERAGAALVHVSSAFLHPTGAGTGERSSADYAQSKREAEALVSAAGVPTAVVRPSIVVGHSATGRITEFQGFYQVVAAVRQGLLPVLPFDPEWRLDLVPCDVVAEAIATVVARAMFGRDFWVTGGERALTVGQSLEAVLDHADRGGAPVGRPRFVDPEIYRNVIVPVFLGSLPRGQRIALSNVADMFCEYLSMPEPFPSSLDELAAAGALGFPDPGSSLRACLDFWQASTDAAPAFVAAGVA